LWVIVGGWFGVTLGCWGLYAECMSLQGGRADMDGGDAVRISSTSNAGIAMRDARDRRAPACFDRWGPFVGFVRDLLGDIVGQRSGEQKAVVGAGAVSEGGRKPGL